MSTSSPALGHDRPLIATPSDVLAVERIEPRWRRDSLDLKRFQNLEFAVSDKDMPRRLSKKTLLEMYESTLVLTTDVFLAARTSEGLKVFTIVRENEPIKGCRWMLGGRSTLPPQGHPWKTAWRQDPALGNLLLTIYSEGGIQPEKIRSAHWLASSHFTFTYPGKNGLETRTNYSQMYVAMIDEKDMNTIELDSQSSGGQWISYKDFQNPEFMESLLPVMQQYLAAIFAEEISKQQRSGSMRVLRMPRRKNA